MYITVQILQGCILAVVSYIVILELFCCFDEVLSELNWKVGLIIINYR
jgi:hypothetical protein